MTLLSLKVGCPIILLRNLSPSSGLCNDTRLVLTEFKNKVLRCSIITGSHAGEEAFIPRIKLCRLPSAVLPYTLNRIQFPIRLAFAMSINKAQSQSFDM